MDKKDFYFLGKITKTSGYKGNLVFFFDVDSIQRYAGLEAVFVNISDELIPFAIKELAIKSTSTAIVSLEDVQDEEQANALVGYDLYLPLSFLPPLTGKKFYFHEVIGFTVIDEKTGLVGNIENIFDHSGQAIFIIVNSNGKEILIPATDEIIQTIVRKNKIIKVNAPDGLIEIYL
jgi:16S rRNA processing protein RimM